MPRMAVIDTTDDGLDSLRSLGEDELIQYTKSINRSARKGKMHNSDPKRRGRGGGRGSYHGNDVENRNRQNFNRTNQDNRHVEVPAQITKDSEDFPSIQESARQIVPRDNHSWRKEDRGDKMRSDLKPSNDRAQKLYHQSETQDSSHREEYRDDPRGRYQQPQDIRRQEESRRGGYGQGRGRGAYNQGLEENWRSAANDFKDSHGRRDNYSRDGRGGHNDNGYNRRKQQQQPVTGGNRAPRVGTSGDAGGHLGNNKYGNGENEQQSHQQQLPSDMAGASKEYTNSSYKYPDSKTKQKSAHNSSTSPTTGLSDGAGDSSSSSKNVVISNKENIQTINVTITSTTTEKKSYAKERRAKGVSRPVGGAVLIDSAESQTPGQKICHTFFFLNVLRSSEIVLDMD